MFTFYRENTAWPFVHALINAHLYIATRKWTLSLLLMYIWETIEFAVVSQLTKTFAENVDDTLISDPLVGFTIISALWLIDHQTHWDVDFRENVPNYIRAVCFIIVGLLATILSSIDDKSGGIVLAIGTLYILITLAFYGPYIWSRAQEVSVAASQSRAAQSVAIWLILIAVITIVAAPRNVPTGEFPYNTFMRVEFTILVVLAAAIVAQLMNYQNLKKMKA